MKPHRTSFLFRHAGLTGAALVIGAGLLLGCSPLGEVLASLGFSEAHRDGLTRMSPWGECVAFTSVGLFWGGGLTRCGWRARTAVVLALAGIVTVVLFTWLLSVGEQVWWAWLIPVGIQIPLALMWSFWVRTPPTAREEPPHKKEAPASPARAPKQPV